MRQGLVSDKDTPLIEAAYHLALRKVSTVVIFSTLLISFCPCLFVHGSKPESNRFFVTLSFWTIKVCHHHKLPLPPIFFDPAWQRRRQPEGHWTGTFGPAHVEQQQLECWLEHSADVPVTTFEVALFTFSFSFCHLSSRGSLWTVTGPIALLWFACPSILRTTSSKVVWPLWLYHVRCPPGCGEGILFELQSFFPSSRRWSRCGGVSLWGH